MARQNRLLVEYLPAMRAMPVTAALELEVFGIPRTAIAAVCPVPMHIVINRAGDRFRPDRAGRWGWVLPIAAVDPSRPELIETEDPFAIIQTGAIIDLAATIGSPAAPGRWALRRGLATVVGAIAPQYVDPEPVRVHRSIGLWLCSGCAGIVVLTGDRDEAEQVLCQIRRIATDDTEPDLAAKPWNRRRLEGLVRKIITADQREREGTLRWACGELGVAAGRGEVRPELARAILVRAGIRAGLGETAAQRLVATSFHAMGGLKNEGERRWPRPI